MAGKKGKGTGKKLAPSPKRPSLPWYPGYLILRMARKIKAMNRVQRIDLLLGIDIFLIFMAVLYGLGILTFPTPELLLQGIFYGIIIGCVYAMIAIGYTMVYGILKFINFAHGEVFMMAPYFVFMFASMYGLNFFLGCILAVALCSIIGAVIEKIAYKPLRKASRLAPLITAIGVSLFLQSAAQMAFGAEDRSLDPLIRDTGVGDGTLYDILWSRISIGPLNFVALDLIIVVASVAMMIGLHLFIQRSKMGKAMRAVADDFETSEVVGIKVDRVVSAAFIIGSAMAAIGGILYVLRRLVINPTLGILPGIKGFTAAVVGGIGSVHGAMFGGLLIGLAENVGINFIPTVYQDAIAFIILILFLLFKPSGIFGKEHETEVRRK